ncbi:hypothetical protein EMIHUDRAFT_453271 [Emiliania huxleyi CCMP1516]|uniref:Uncharacterized protein n=2 Tax=Emiliania huxleyi TaxID=2903 RepID=A0A0D3I8U2_EMIH1|nr:hypothetical protein EMIHUDRAFT_453271 [Emiliania huxleyi CCMP1516]EOD07677.1 hypothetical protein EMIHUDRAFT_453271 [Emiliania huxleyi CCMP1516]|eukprot:XP_005760106.1 hypothetical protein EMIHUDRAFT_453271 [Emiliania huxleyi CCMP1516]
MPTSPPPLEELVAKHTFLGPLLPPPAFDVPSALRRLSLPPQLQGPATRPGIRSESLAVGRALGGVDKATAERWRIIAGRPDLLESTARAVQSVHILPFSGNRASSRRATRFIVPNGHRSLLKPDTPRWALLTALARCFVRQQDEGEREHLARCCRFDAWAYQAPLDKPAIALVILLMMACYAETEPEFPPLELSLRVRDGIRPEDDSHASRDPTAYCLMENCRHWVRRTEVDQLFAHPHPCCPLCGGAVSFAWQCGATEVIFPTRRSSVAEDGGNQDESQELA